MSCCFFLYPTAVLLTAVLPLAAGLFFRFNTSLKFSLLLWP